MSFLLDHPTTVLVRTDDESVVEAVRTAALSGTATAVLGISSTDDLLAELERSDEVGCVVVIDGPSDDGLVETCRAIRDADDLLPVVAMVDEAPTERVSRATRAGATVVVPVAIDDEALRDSLDDQLARYERRRRQAAESGALHSFMDWCQHAFYLKDDEGRHVVKSPTPGDLSADAFVGKTDVDVYGDSETNRTGVEEDRRVAETEEPVYDRESSYVVESGERWARTTKVPWTYRGDVVGLVGLTMDVTDEVERKIRLERHEERIDQFTRYVRHDLKNPLQVASGSLELARETGDDTHLDRIERALGRIEESLEDLSSLSRADTDTWSSADHHIQSPMPLATVVDDVWSVVGTEEATLQTPFDDARIIAPESSVRPIFQNLLGNAIDHVGPAVTVTVGTLDEGGFFVADDGPGIPPSDRDAVLEDGYTTTEDGTGTGLSIVADVVDRHSWSIDVTESDDGGARFEIGNCPVVTRDSDGYVEAEALPLTDGFDIGSPKVSGRATYDEASGRWTVEAAGQNVWRDVNEFYFVDVETDGPVRIVARIPEFDEVSEWSTAGLMVRDSHDSDASYGYVGVSGDHGTVSLWRPETGADGVSQHLEDPFEEYQWYRLDRVGDLVTAYCSPDGDEWFPVDQRRVDLDDPVSVGLAVCSTYIGHRCRATFEDVRVVRLDAD